MGQVFKSIKLLHININGIYSSRTEFEQLINEHKPDIITMNETHLKLGHRFTIPNYTIYRKDRQGQKGGVAIFYQNNIPVSEIQIPNEYQHVETLLIKIHIRNWPLHVCTIYNPPKTPLPTQYLNYLNKYKKLIILGDLNAHHPLLGDNFNTKNPQGTHLIEHLKHSTLHQIFIPGPTRIPQISTHSFTTPDKILATTTVLNKAREIQILQPINSDHLPVFVTLGTPSWTHINTHTPINIYKYTEADWNIYREELDSNLGHFPISSINDIDKADHHLVSTIIKAREKAVPKKLNRHPGIQQSRALPPHIINSIKLKRRAFRLYKRTRTEEDRIFYRKIQEEVKIAIQNYRASKYVKLTTTLNENFKTTTKKFWKTINKIQNKHPYQNSPLKINQDIIFDDQTKVEIFKDYLETIFQSTPNQNTDIQHFNQVNTFVSNHPFLYNPIQTITDISCLDAEFSLVTPEDILTATKKTRNTAPGPDSINNILLKNLSFNTLIFLAHIYTASLITGHLPQRWKEAHILVFPKQGKSPDNTANYRPISLTNTMSKILEKIIIRKLESKLTNVIPKTQAGFTPNTEIIDQLLTVITPIEHATKNRKHTGLIIALDVRKAFDTMWHNGLRLKLTQHNFPLNILRWISHFLYNRRARIKISGTLSSEFTMQAGAPQGSSISPILYNIYVSDIPQPHTPNTGLAQFADDTCFWVTAPTLRSASIHMNSTLTDYTNWTNKWLIQINTDKTQAIAIKLRKKRLKMLEQYPIRINNDIVPYKRQITYLGLTFTDKLKITRHLMNIKNRIKRPINTIKYVSYKHGHCDSHILLTLYKALVRPIITYAAPFMLQTTQAQFKKLEATERRTLRYCLKLPPRTPSAVIHTMANIENIQQHIITLTKNYYNRVMERPNYRHLTQNPQEHTLVHKIKQIAT